MADKPAGKRPGSPKTGGRKAGTPNKNPRSVKELAGKYGNEAVEKLVHIMRKSKIEYNKIIAAKEILDRAYGRPTQAIASDPEQPMNLQITWLPPQDK